MRQNWRFDYCHWLAAQAARRYAASQRLITEAGLVPCLRGGFGLLGRLLGAFFFMVFSSFRSSWWFPGQRPGRRYREPATGQASATSVSSWRISFGMGRMYSPAPIITTICEQSLKSQLKTLSFGGRRLEGMRRSTQGGGERERQGENECWVAAWAARQLRGFPATKYRKQA